MSTFIGPGVDQASQLRSLVAGWTEARTECRAGDAGRTADRPRASSAKVIAVASGKGGVGKTNLCVNLAVSLAGAGHRTVLVDGDLGLGNADVVCGVNPRLHLGHCVDGDCTLEEVVVPAPGGFRLVPGASGIARLADLDEARRNGLVRAFSTLERDADVILVDCGAGIGASVLALVGAADLALIVTTPEPTAITDAYALIKCVAFRGGGPEACVEAMPPVQMALVVNESRDDAEASSVHLRMNAVCQRFLGLQLPFAGGVKLDSAVPRAVRARVPLLLHDPGAAASQDVRNMAGWVGAASGATTAYQRGDSRTLRTGGGLVARVLRSLRRS